jgi:hypothetical protein
MNAIENARLALAEIDLRIQNGEDLNVAASYLEDMLGEAVTGGIPSYELLEMVTAAAKKNDLEELDRLMGIDWY